MAKGIIYFIKQQKYYMKLLRFNLIQYILILLAIILSSIDLYYIYESTDKTNVLNTYEYSYVNAYRSRKHHHIDSNVKPWIKLGNYEIQEKTTYLYLDDNGILYKTYLRINDSNQKSVPYHKLELPKLEVSDNDTSYKYTINQDEDGIYFAFITQVLSDKYITINDHINTPIELRLNPFSDTFKVIFAILILTATLIYSLTPYGNTSSSILFISIGIPAAFAPTSTLLLIFIYLFLYIIVNRIKISSYRDIKFFNYTNLLIILLIGIGLSIFLTRYDNRPFSITTIGHAFSTVFIMMLYVVMCGGLIRYSYIILRLLITQKSQGIQSLEGSNFKIVKGSKSTSRYVDITLNGNVLLKSVDVNKNTYEKLQEKQMLSCTEFLTDNKGNYIFY